MNNSKPELSSQPDTGQDTGHYLHPGGNLSDINNPIRKRAPTRRKVPTSDMNKPDTGTGTNPGLTPPSLAVEAAKVDGFGNMGRGNVGGSLHIRYRTAHFQYPVIGSGREVETGHGALQQLRTCR